MAGRKKTDAEKEILELEKELKDITEQTTIAKNQIKEFSDKKESGKAYQSTMRYAILFDKTQLIKNKIKDLKQSQDTGEDKVVKWSEETCRRFLEWLKNTDPGYYYFLNNIMLNKNTEIKDVMERFDENRHPTYKKVEMINEAEKLIVEQYCKNHNLKLIPKEEKDE